MVSSWSPPPPPLLPPLRIYKLSVNVLFHYMLRTYIVYNVRELINFVLVSLAASSKWRKISLRVSLVEALINTYREEIAF